MHLGLSDIQVKNKIIQFGYNELLISKPKTIFKIALEIIKEPMFLLLISCGLLYIIIGDYREGLILLSATWVIIFITFYQYKKSERAMDALKQLAAPSALVIRNGCEFRISSRELVPDDIMILREGDRITADAVLLETASLMVDESLLTGESLPVIKNVYTKNDENAGMLFAGTLVIKGSGLCKVVQIGMLTRLGRIGSSLQGIIQDETLLQKEMKGLIRNLFIIGIFISVGVIISFYLARGDLIKSILNGLATSMAILPEEFPVILTVFLAIGAWRLSKNNVLTRKPPAIETLGATTTLCVDKTGTITQNLMKIDCVYDGYSEVRKDDIVHPTPTLLQLIIAANFAKHENSIDPMESAIGQLYNELHITSPPLLKLIKTYPLTSALAAMTQVYEDYSSKKYLIYSKGAPESIFDICHLGIVEKNKYILILNSMAERGLRVIAVAKAEMLITPLPDSHVDIDHSFLGLIALHDPIRPEVPASIQQCFEAGIKVIMITGDFAVTAKYIAHQIGLPFYANIINGNELDKMSDSTLQNKILTTSVFARVIPEQKLRIVQALKSNNEVVAMTGDGVNDAPALKAAHIGIAMGKRGTDVAREASALILLDDNFSSIVSAIRLGRKIYDNLQKAMSYILSIHIPIIGLAMIPAMFANVPLILFPVHIVFLELIIDPVSSVAFEAEMEEKDIMKRLPRKMSEKFFGLKTILWSIGKGVLFLLLILLVFIVSINKGYDDTEVRTITYSTLIIGNVFLILSCLSNTRSFLGVIQEHNLKVFFILMLSLLVLTMLILIPSVQKVFGFKNPGLNHFIWVFLASLIFLIILETIKKLQLRRKSAPY